MPGEKTEPATAKRRGDERKKGNVLTSKDVTTVATLIASTYVIGLMGSEIINSLEAFFYYCISLMEEGGVDVVVRNADFIAYEYVRTLVSIIAIPMGTTLFVAIAITMYQTKGLITREPIKPKLSKLNPISGLKKIFSLKSVIDALKNLLKMTILFYIIYNFYKDNVLTYRLFLSLGPVESGVILIDDIMTMMNKIIMAFIVVAVIDYAYQKWEYERKMRMSKEDIKEEYKQMEGDPKVKAKIKQKQQTMARSRMMNTVPTADVIIRNPTHYAAALRFKVNVDSTPIILALGEDDLARQIIRSAERHEIPIVEDVPLARALYSMGQVNAMIPPELYDPVAKIIIEVLAIGGSKNSET